MNGPNDRRGPKPPPPAIYRKVQRGIPSAKQRARLYVGKKTGVLRLSRAMYEGLECVHIARLGKARGLAAHPMHPTLNALYRRGLVDVRDIPQEEGAEPSCLWFLTDEGKARLKAGPDG